MERTAFGQEHGCSAEALSAVAPVTIALVRVSGYSALMCAVSPSLNKLCARSVLFVQGRGIATASPRKLASKAKLASAFRLEGLQK